MDDASLATLFGEDTEANYVGTYSHATSCASKLDLPPLTRQESQFAGLKNQYFHNSVIKRGATCYMNSLLQALYMTPEFRSLIFGLPICVFSKNAK